MKFTDIPPWDPWFASEQTQALIAWLREERIRSHDGVIDKVRKADPIGPLEYVGRSDAYRTVGNLLQPSGDS